MLIKPTLIFCSLLLIVNIANAQENRLLITFKNSSSKSIKKGDAVRLAYPIAKLDYKKSKNAPIYLGLRGKVDSISETQLFLKTDKRTSKILTLNISDISAIKKISGAGTFITFLGTAAAIGTTAVLYATSLNVNGGVIAFVGAFSVFPAAIITGTLFYPTKPHNKVGENYTLKVITINK